MEILTTLVFWAAFGAICYVMAKNRGRNVILGVVAGLVLGLIAVIYYWIVGDTKELRDEKFAKKVIEIKERFNTK